MTYLKTATASVLVLCATVSAPADDVIDAHIKAIGGQQAIDKIKTIVRSGSAKFESQFGNFEGEVEDAYVVGKKAYTKVDLGVMAETTGWDGEDAWVDNAQQGVVDASKEQAEQLQLSAAVDPLVGLLQWAGKDGVEKLGQKDFDGKPCDALKIKDEDFTMYLDKKTHHLIGITTTSSDPQLGQLDIKIALSDFQETAGVQFARKSVMDVGDGMMVITLEYEDTSVNEPLDDAQFKRP